MDKYDLLNADDCGRFARLISDLTGNKIHFVLSFALPDGEGMKQGALTNVEPDSAVKILLGAAAALADKTTEFEERDLRVN